MNRVSYKLFRESLIRKSDNCRLSLGKRKSGFLIDNDVVATETREALFFFRRKTQRFDWVSIETVKF